MDRLDAFDAYLKIAGDALQRANETLGFGDAAQARREELSALRDRLGTLSQQVARERGVGR